MTREEIVKVRADALVLKEVLDRQGDTDASAPSIRKLADLVVKLSQHALDRMPRRS